MQSTYFIICFTRVINRLNWLARYLLIPLMLFAGSGVQGAGPVTNKPDTISALIQRLGVDASSDAAARGKLRALLSQNKTATALDDVQEGIWSGVIERVYVDNLDAQGNLVPGPTQYYLNAGVQHFQIFFLNEEIGHAASGKYRVVRGYLSDRRILVLESEQNHQDMLRSNKPRYRR